MKKPLLLWKISQHDNLGYDAYSSAVVCAASEDEARNMDPMDGEPMDWSEQTSVMLWCASPDRVTVKLIGTAVDGLPRGLVCSDFSAG